MRHSFVRAFRSLRRAPGFVALAVVSVGLGIGISTSAYAMVDRLMHPLTPYENVDELFRIQSYGYLPRNGPTAAQLRDIWPRGGPFVAITMFGFGPQGLADANGILDPRRFDRIAPNLFDVLGVRPRLGRAFREEDRASQNTVIVSDAFWHSRYRDRNTIGDASVTLQDKTYAIIGVMPPGFSPSPVRADGWLPFGSEETPFGILIVRTRPGLTAADLQAPLKSIAASAQQFVRAGAALSFFPWPLRPDVLQLSDYHKAMLAAALGILLIACANVSALMLARGLSRRRDAALRLSLGATRTDIVLDVLAEVVVLTGLGGAAGVLAAVWGFSALAAAAPPEMAWLGLSEPSWSWRVLGAAFGAAILSAALAGILPALQAARVDPAEPLKDSAGTTTGRARTRFRVLVIAELALSLVLLSGASLVAKASSRVAHYDFGFDAAGLLDVRVRANASGRGAAGTAMRTTDDLAPIVARIRSIDGVTGVAAMSVATPDSATVISEDAAAGAPPLHLLSYQQIDAGLVRTLGLVIIAGRDVDAGDRESGAVILDDSAAHALFRHGSAIGRMIKLGDRNSAKPWVRVVGVVRHTTFFFHEDPDDHGDPVVFAYTPHDPLGWSRFIVRQLPHSPAVSFAIQRRIRDALGAYGYVSVAPLLSYYEQMLRGRYFVAEVFALLGAASLALAAAGLFSVLAFAVGERMREFAVRIALGARPRDVLQLVLRDGLELALGGTAFGAIGAMRAGGLLWRVLYDVPPTDVAAIVTAEVILLAVTMLASVIPALRAMRADPIVVLRAT